MEVMTWFGIILCLVHSAMFSGLNLGFFGMSRLRLEVQEDLGNADAIRILNLRKDAHFLLATLLWGNVASNVLLTLFCDSVMSGIAAFFFSTVGITFLGEIFPQAYLSRNALKASVVLVPAIRFYQGLLYPLAKPTAIFLDKWLGKEKITYFDEEELMRLLKRHANAQEADVDKHESIGAMNFLALDDIFIKDEGEIINPASIIIVPVNKKGLPIFPDFEREAQDKFLQKLNISGEKWIIFTDAGNNPLLVLNADQFLRDAMYAEELKSIYTYCHRPIIVTDSATKLGDVLLKFKVRAEHSEDDVIDNDLLLYWSTTRRIITGADILGRLMRGIIQPTNLYNQKIPPTDNS